MAEYENKLLSKQSGLTWRGWAKWLLVAVIYIWAAVLAVLPSE